MKQIILITGGQRSGKSTYAEQLALSLSPRPVYMATAHIWDEDFRQRVARHQQRRGPEWTNIEEELYLSRHDVAGRVVLIDCCTLWATNFFWAASQDAAGPPASDGDAAETPSQPVAAEAAGVPLPDVDAILAQLCCEFDLFTQQEATFIFVTNEIGMGGTSPNALQRRFTDLLGFFNQHVAARADRVVLMVSGLPVEVKAGGCKSVRI